VKNNPVDWIDPYGYFWEKSYFDLLKETQNLVNEANEKFGSDDKAKHKWVSQQLSDSFDPSTALDIGIAKELKDLLDGNPNTKAEWGDLGADLKGILNDIMEDLNNSWDWLNGLLKEEGCKQ